MQKEFDKVDVGYYRVESIELPNHGFMFLYSYELDMASDPHGDIGQFYRDSSADNPASHRICYIQNCPNGFITSSDSEFKRYAYTYGDILAICKGDKVLADAVLEYSCGSSPSVVYDEIKDCRSKNE